jgi:hypothetical protein
LDNVADVGLDGWINVAADTESGLEFGAVDAGIKEADVIAGFSEKRRRFSKGGAVLGEVKEVVVDIEDRVRGDVT